MCYNENTKKKQNKNNYVSITFWAICVYLAARSELYLFINEAIPINFKPSSLYFSGFSDA